MPVQASVSARELIGKDVARVFTNHAGEEVVDGPHPCQDFSGQPYLVGEHGHPFYLSPLTMPEVIVDGVRYRLVSERTPVAKPKDPEPPEPDPLTLPMFGSDGQIIPLSESQPHKGHFPK